MVTFRVSINPDVLIWARQTSGLTIEEAAQKMKVLISELWMWEEGTEQPPIEKLREAARVYRYPLAVLLLPEPPSGIQVLRDFRLLPENREKSWSPPLRRQIRRIQFQQQNARELAQTVDEAPPPIKIGISLQEPSKEAGARIRTWLLATDSLHPAVIEHPTLRDWMNLIEGKGILVTQIEGVALEEMRGFTIGSRPFPVIALNGRDSSAGKLFTLMHELVHVLLMDEAICDLAVEGSSAANNIGKIERFCDQVSAEVLMPAPALLGDVSVLSAGPQTEWSLEELRRLASPFSVSSEALLLRLVTLGKASMEFYWRIRPTFIQLYREIREREQEKLKATEGGPSPYILKIRNFGRRFVSDVLDAYERDLIDPSDVSDLLDIKVNNIPKLVERMAN